MASNNSSSGDTNKPSSSEKEATTVGLPRGLLGKGGTPVSKSTRLPSVRAARDLTLGGAQRKSFKPNIPVRPKDKTPSGPIEDKLVTKEKRPKRDRSDKTNKTRSQPNTIQSQSIFEQGPTEKTIKRESIYSGGFGGRESSTSRSSTSVSVKHTRQTKAETQEILDQLLRDDFIADDEDDLTDVTYQPVTLPLLNPAIYDQIAKDEIKAETGSSPANLHDPTMSGHVIDHQDESLKLVLVQLPDCLPGLLAGPDDRGKPQKVKQEPSTSQIQTSTLPEDDLSAKLSEKCRLTDLNEGRIGKIQIMSSGRARLVLGDVMFDINRGAPCGFLQDLVCVDTQNESGQVTCLGSVKEKLVVVPNIDSLLE